MSSKQGQRPIELTLAERERGREIKIIYLKYNILLFNNIILKVN